MTSCHLKPSTFDLKTLQITPAMAAGLSDHVWNVEEDLVALIPEPVAKKRGPYKKKAA
jgi:hypothetical protein